MRVSRGPTTHPTHHSPPHRCPLPPDQVLADPHSGRVTAIDCDCDFSSPSLRALVVGSGPVGRFTLTLSNVAMRGEAIDVHLYRADD
jgi:hypothetical protein